MPSEGFSGAEIEQAMGMAQDMSPQQLQQKLQQAEQALQPDLAWRRAKQVGATHHMRDVLEGIIQHHCKLVGEQAIGALDLTQLEQMPARNEEGPKQVEERK